MHIDKLTRPSVGARFIGPHCMFQYPDYCVKPHNRAPIHWQSLPLYRRVTCFAVEVIQVFGLNEIKAGFIYAVQ